MCDVLIVGAGPTGLLMAILLTRYGLQCRVIDKSPTRSEQSRALAMQPRTLETFCLLGLDQHFIKRGKKIFHFNVHSQKEQIAHVDFNELETPFSFLLSIPQSSTEEILEDHLKSLGVLVERCSELIYLHEKDREIIARVEKEGKEEEISTKWVIGADGAHSFIRKYLGLSFEGRSFPDVFSLADVRLNWKYFSDEVHAFWHPEGVLAVIPLPEEGFYRLIFELSRCQGEEKDISDNLSVQKRAPTIEEALAIVHSHADPKAEISNPKWLANFHVNSRLIHPPKKRNFFLVGDAMHIHSPIGGQGMNTGLQDAFNLAWKIALVHQDKADPKLLDSYYAERHSVAKSLLKGTERATFIATLKNHLLIAFRNSIASLLLRIPSVRKKLIHVISQLYITYPKSLFIQGSNVGSRMPNIVLERKERIDLFSLFQGELHFTILLFSKRIRNHEELLKGVKLPVKVVQVSLSRAEGDHYFISKEEMEKFGIEEEEALIIRPDGYICYREERVNLEKIRAYLNSY